MNNLGLYVMLGYMLLVALCFVFALRARDKRELDERKEQWRKAFEANKYRVKVLPSSGPQIHYEKPQPRTPEEIKDFAKAWDSAVEAGWKKNGRMIVDSRGRNVYVDAKDMK